MRVILITWLEIPEVALNVVKNIFLKVRPKKSQLLRLNQNKNNTEWSQRSNTISYITSVYFCLHFKRYYKHLQISLSVVGIDDIDYFYV